MHSPIEFAIDWQVRPPIGILGRQSLIKIDAEAWGIARMHHSAGKSIGMREDAVGLLRVAHILLDAKIRNAQVEMQRRSHANRTQIGCAVRSRPDLIQLGQAGDFPQMRHSSRVHNGGPNVIDQLLLDKLLAIINGVEYFADGQWRSGVLADKPEALLQLRGNRILEPKQMIRLEALS